MALFDYSPQSAGRNARRAANRPRRHGGGGDEGRPTFGGGGSSSRDRDGRDGRDRREGRDERRPIGVNDDYRTPSVRDLTGMSARGAEGAAEMGVGHGTPYMARPKYFDGDEFRMANVSPDSIIAIKKAMFNAGLISQKDINGAWDYKTAQAYRDVLAYANSRGITDQQGLTELSMAGLSSGASGGGGSSEDGGGGAGGGILGFDENGEPIMAEFQAPPLELRTSNKDDLRKVFREAVVQMLGEGWSNEQINELVDAYNWKEVGIQKEAYDQDVARLKAEFMGQADPLAGKTTLTDEQPGGSLNIASPEAFIEEEARRRDPGGFQATQVAEDYAPMFWQALGGYAPGGGSF